MHFSSSTINCLFLSPSSCAWSTVRPNKPKHWSLEQRKFMQGPSKENGWFILKRPELLEGFQRRVFRGKICREGCRVCDLPLIDWGVGNRVMFQESQSSAWIQPVWGPWLMLSLKLPSFTWVGGFSSYRRTQRFVPDCYVYSLRRKRESLHYCFLTAPPLFLYSLPSLVSNCLNLPFGTQGRSRGWNLSPTNKKWGTRKAFVPRRASQYSAQFHVHDINNLIMPMFKEEEEEGKVSFKVELNPF